MWMKVPTYIQYLRKDTPNMPPTATIKDIKAYLVGAAGTGWVQERC
jgi:hypothetical protein